MNGLTICVIGDMQIRPNMNLDHIEHIGRYITDKKPDVIVQIGDWWDMPSLSSYDRGKASFEGRRVKEDIEAGHEGMRRLLEPIRKLQQSQRYFKKKVYNPRMVFLNGNHECLTPDTEVMTSDGFKPITEVTTNDLVATMNSDGNFEWNNPLDTVVKSYKDDLVVFNSRSFSFAGTKSHRMYYKDIYGKLHEKESNDMPRHFSVITSFENQNRDYPISEDLLKLSAWLCTDSYFTEYGKPIIYQRESNAHKIQVLLDSLGVGYTKRVRDRDIKEICGKVLKKRCEKGVEFHLQNNPSSVKSNKYLPKFVSQLSQKQWEIFLEVLIDADGTVPKNAKKSRVFYGQKRICDDVQFCAVQFGWTASLTEYRPNHWKVNLVKRTTRRQEGLEKEYVPYDGLVCCLVMPHENFVIRKNNKVHLTGNCRLDRAAQDNPELVGFIGTKELHIEQYGWEVYEFLKPVNIEGINFVHYLSNPMTGRPYSGSAAGMLKTVGASFVMGHKQVLDIAIRTTLEGKNQIGIINGACLTSDHKVLHSDLIYRRLGDLKAGDKLVSFDEFSGVDGKRGRRYKTGTVEKVRLAQEEVFLVKLKSGKTFKATKDHRWLVKTGSFYYWKYTHELRKGTRIPKLLEEWEQDFSYNAGWLSGIYDGEGCFYTRKTSTGNHIGQLGVTQKPGLVCNKIKEILNDLVGVGTLTHHIDKSGCDNLRIKGGLKNIAKVLGVLQPIRLMNKFKPELMGRITTKDSDLDTVVSIEAIGVQEIVQVKVDESTMVVEGYGHHNCYPHFEDYKGHQGGNSHFRGITMLYEAKDGFALPSFISLDFLKEKYS